LLAGDTVDQRVQLRCPAFPCLAPGDEGQNRLREDVLELFGAVEIADAIALAMSFQV